MYEHVIKQWEAVRRIPFPRVIAEDKDVLLDFIETPLQEAIGIMFDKHVPTSDSSCNIMDYGEGKARITVVYDYLSSRNRKVVDRYDLVQKSPIFHEKIGRIITLAGLFFPIERHELPLDIGRKAVVLAEEFEVQPKLLPPNF